MLCGALYIPPEGFKYSDIGMFDDLTTYLINFNNDNQYYVLIMGDFNSRTGTQQDFISFDYNFLDGVYLDDALTDTLVDEDTLQTLGISQNLTSSDITSNNYGNRLIDVMDIYLMDELLLIIVKVVSQLQEFV